MIQRPCINIVARIVTGALLMLATSSRSGAVTKMYWSDRGANTITRANLDGTDQEIIVSGLGQARGMDIDELGGKVYWNDNGTDKIQRSNLDGTDIEDLVVTGLNFPAGIALDTVGKKMYWADALNHKIQRANLDGSNVEDLVIDLKNPYFITLDIANQHVYWTDYGTDKIQRSDFDGANVLDLVTTGLQTSRGIDLDLDGGKMYWADRGTDKIQRSNLNGMQIEDLHQIILPPGVRDAAPHGVAVDSERGHLYWVDNGTVKLQRSELDGSNVVDILTADNSEMSRPWQIVLVDEFPVSPGDANQDLTFDQLDLVQVLIAGKYGTGSPATWGEGDWNGGPGGTVGAPPSGDGVFDQLDIIAALTVDRLGFGGAALSPHSGNTSDDQTSLVYDAVTGELSVNPPSGIELTSINISSAGALFIGDKPSELNGAFDNFAADNVFKATFGGSFGSISLGQILDAGMGRDTLVADLTAVGSLAGGGGLGDVDLVYIPEPATLSFVLGAMVLLILATRLRNLGRAEVAVERVWMFPGRNRPHSPRKVP